MGFFLENHYSDFCVQFEFFYQFPKRRGSKKVDRFARRWTRTKTNLEVVLKRSLALHWNWGAGVNSSKALSFQKI